MVQLPADPDFLRLTAFLSIFVVLALGELVWPRRPLTVSKPRRWLINLAMVTTNTLLVRLLFPLAPIGLAALAQAGGWGLFNQIPLPGPAAIVASLLVLDLIIYQQHRLFHRVSFFWRIHRMHHTDLDLDVSSGTRFHPLEILLSLVIKLSAVLLFGVPPLAILLFEILLNGTSLFNHANLLLPLAIDRWLRLFVVTPDMHRVHHSVVVQETNSNFGFNLPWWDRLFGTYRAEPRDGHQQMTIGLAEWRDLQALGWWQLLRLPFVHPLPRTRP